MRALGIAAAAVVGFFAGMVLAGITLTLAGAGHTAQEWGIFLGAVAGGVGLAVLAARLIPAKPAGLRRDQDILKDRQQRIIRRG